MKADMARAGITYAGITAATLPAAGWFGAGKSEPPSEDYLLSNAILVDSASTVLLDEDGIPIVYN